MNVSPRDAALHAVREALGDRVVTLVRPSDRRAWLEVRPEDVPEASRILFADLGARLQIATGSDLPDALEVLYHWAFDAAGLVVSVRARLPRENPVIGSIARVCKGAEWIEREMWELLGIRFENHPDLRHLLLADDWPDGNWPLRRDGKA
jgi:Ni,Fe-hydrogenase III component G